MADDIDDLLDEVEKKYISASSIPPNQKRQCTDLFQGVCSESELKKDSHLLQKTIPTPQSAILNQSQSNRKCLPVYLSGSATPAGHSISGNNRACSKLLCLNCDFDITYFDDYEWIPSTTYLFLRNYMPDFAKLSSNLKTRAGCRAYACQCTWRNVTDLTTVDSDRHLTWICSKH